MIAGVDAGKASAKQPVLEEEQIAAFFARFHPGMADAEVAALRTRACLLCEQPPRKGRSSIEVSRVCADELCDGSGEVAETDTSTAFGRGFAALVCERR